MEEGDERKRLDISPWWASVGFLAYLILILLIYLLV